MNFQVALLFSKRSTATRKLWCQDTLGLGLVVCLGWRRSLQGSELGPDGDSKLTAPKQFRCREEIAFSWLEMWFFTPFGKKGKHRSVPDVDCVSGLASYEAARQALEMNWLVAAAEHGSGDELLLIVGLMWVLMWEINEDKFFSCSIFPFLPPSVPALVRDVLTVAPFRGKQGGILPLFIHRVHLKLFSSPMVFSHVSSQSSDRIP